MAIMEIKLGFSNGFDSKKTKVDETIFVYYLKHFIDSFVKNEKGYRIGYMSKNIIFEGRTYGHIGNFAKKVTGAKELEKNVLELNPGLGVEGFSRFTWISLDEYIFTNFEDIIIEKIKTHKNMNHEQPRLKINTQTYEFKGKQVVFCVYDEAASGTEIFAVPVEVATRLNLEDYDGEEVSRFDDFLEEIKEYSLNHLSFSNND